LTFAPAPDLESKNFPKMPFNLFKRVSTPA